MAAAPARQAKGTILLGHLLAGIPGTEASAALAALRKECPWMVHDLLGETWVGERIEGTQKPDAFRIEALSAAVRAAVPPALAADPALAVFRIRVIETDMPLGPPPARGG